MKKTNKDEIFVSLPKNPLGRPLLNRFFNSHSPPQNFYPNDSETSGKVRRAPSLQSLFASSSQILESNKNEDLIQVLRKHPSPTQLSESPLVVMPRRNVTKRMAERGFILPPTLKTVSPRDNEFRYVKLYKDYKEYAADIPPRLEKKFKEPSIREKSLPRVRRARLRLVSPDHLGLSSNFSNLVPTTFPQTDREKSTPRISKEIGIQSSPKRFKIRRTLSPPGPPRKHWYEMREPVVFSQYYQHNFLPNHNSKLLQGRIRVKDIYEPILEVTPLFSPKILESHNIARKKQTEPLLNMIESALKNMQKSKNINNNKA